MNAPVEEVQPSRYLVGIDLGTTNSAVTYVDTAESSRRVRVLPIPQLVAPGQTEALETLPSFHYQPAEGEFAANSLQLPWTVEPIDYVVGAFARDQAVAVPGRLIASAKSWLCHSGVDRTAALLPWHGASDVDRLSPVEVGARFLDQIRKAWNLRFPDEPLERQDVVLTLPASFDEVARELTIQAAKLANLPRVVLIEEPQAAFYAWIDAHRSDWEQKVHAGQTILVCDIGGGTSDFTLIRAQPNEHDRVRFHRVAVGEHLILGGDNLDLALAHHLERRILGGDKADAGERLDPRRWDTLIRVCRNVKETLLAEDAPETTSIHLPSSGSKLIGGGMQIEVTRAECHRVLVDGFLPDVPLDSHPQQRQSGFQEFGLPFAADSAVTRYLAEFLTTHRLAGRSESDCETSSNADPARPDVVLFNGGFFASPVLRDRLLQVIESWFRTEADPNWSPHILQNDRLDLAVARGASYYGLVRRGEGVRIAAGLARTYYVGVESDGAAESAALCLLPAGVEPGQQVDLAEREFRLRISQPIEFPLYVSSTRLTDQPGELVSVDREQLTPLPPIRTVLRTRSKDETGTVRVQLHAGLTEIGTLDVWCGEVDGNRRWKLVFDVRCATQTDVDAHSGAAEQEGVLDESAWNSCRKLIADTFGPEATGQPERLARQIAREIDLSRKDWPTSLLRGIWEMLMERPDGRKISSSHEARWLNLLGFALRPGYGLALDDWRVAETWRLLGGQSIHATPSCRAEWWILWRRIGGGLTSGQQLAIASPLLSPIRQLHRQVTTGKGRGADVADNPHEAAEIWRLLGSFEHLPLPTKLEFARMLVDLLPKPKMQPMLPAAVWSLGRVAARNPVYGPLNGVIPPETVSPWLRKLTQQREAGPMWLLTVMQIARKTGDRYRDLSDADRDRAAGWLERHDAPAHFVQLVTEGGQLDHKEQSLVFGESLPKGLRVVA